MDPAGAQSTMQGACIVLLLQQECAETTRVRSQSCSLMNDCFCVRLRLAYILNLTVGDFRISVKNIVAHLSAARLHSELTECHKRKYSHIYFAY